MSRFWGPQRHEPLFARGRNKGARALARYGRRRDAEQRDEVTPPGRRSTKKRAKRARSNVAGEST